ncbi:restriction endonuclease subunit S [Gallibacterium anatis]|uniref:restriction endonuclease subunit S n=1 Tax=Gallibacterium anatis TaxID=750 RepID=UPI0039FC0C7B
MSEWNIKKLSEVADIIGGGTPSSKENAYYENGTIAWLTPKDLSNHKEMYISKGERNITQLGLKNSSAKLLPKGAVLFSSRAPIGYVAIAKNTLSTNQGFKSLILKSGHIPEFYYYLLKNNISLFEARASGSTFKEVSGQVVKDTELKIPDTETQRNIVKILKPLDDKITLNTQTNQTLEQIAQGIFKHWFIDFAPVHAKANALARGETIEQAELAAMACLSGKTVEKITALKTEDPTAYHQLQQTAAAFPSEFVETEMGQVPKGWEICSITDKRVCSIIKPKIHHFSGEKDYIATANVSQNTIVGELEKITFDNRPSRANMQPIVDSIWFAKMVGEHKAIMIDENDEFLLKNTILSTGFLGIKPQQYKKCFLYCFINSENFTLLKNSLATGAVQIALNNTSFSSMNIILPSDNVLEYFENKVSTLFSKIAASHRENKSLAETRDLLLPKLLNGEIEL